MNNSWGSSLVVTGSMLYFLCARHNEQSLSHRSPGHVRDGHLNHTLSSHIAKYEELAYPLDDAKVRTNANVLDYKWIPLLQMLAPTQIETYNAVVTSRAAAASNKKLGLFGSSELISRDCVGPSGHRRTPHHLVTSRAYLRYATGCDGAPVTTIEERRLFNKLMSDNPGVGTKGAAD